MFLENKKTLIRWVLILASFIIVSAILWNTYIFFQEIKKEERIKMENFAAAVAEVNQKALNEQGDNLNFPLRIITSNTSNPRIFVTKENVMEAQNIDEEKSKDSLYLKGKVLQFSKENDPIPISYYDDQTKKQENLGILYYGNSEALIKLKYYPMALLLIILLFAAVAYFFFSASSASDQNKLWTGMAKETAHQIGTPLSSLVGWAEILKSENVNPDYIVEMEKDIDRLQTITERFSKIGSVPKLERMDIVAETKKSYAYLKSRTSKLVDFSLETPETPIFCEMNVQLYSWTIENMVKNAIDAMKGKGSLHISIAPLEDLVKIQITDNGKGISKSQFKKIFQPGFTSKKRGWGLGLSLAKRIVEDYHSGRIKVLKSEVGKGTTMQISLKTVV